MPSLTYFNNNEKLKEFSNSNSLLLSNPNVINSKDVSNIIENTNSLNNTNLFPIDNDITLKPAMVSNKKGKKTTGKKKFVNLDFDFGANLATQQEEEIDAEIDMLEEDILVKNLANKKAKENKGNKLIPKKKK